MVYSIKLYIGIAILIWSALSTKVSFISVLHFLNGVQLLNATFVLLLVVVPVILIFPVTKIYASEISQRFDSNELVKNLVSLSGK